MEKQRLASIDVLKAIGICLVVIGHVNTPLSSIIYSIHMPLFFYLAGAFDYTPDSTSFMKALKKLSLIYLTAAFSALIITSIKNYLLHRPPLDLLSELFGIFYYMNFESLKNHYGFILWFFPTLIVLKFLNLILSQIVSRDVKLLIFLSLPLISNLNAPLGIQSAIIASPFYAAGTISFKNHLSKFKVSHINIICFAILFVTTNVLIFRTPIVNIAEHTRITIIGYLTIILFLISLKYILDIHITKNIQIFSLLGTHTIFIMVTHTYTNNGIFLFTNHFSLGWQYCAILSLLSATLLTFTWRRIKNYVY